MPNKDEEEIAQTLFKKAWWRSFISYYCKNGTALRKDIYDFKPLLKKCFKPLLKKVLTKPLWPYYNRFIVKIRRRIHSFIY